MTFTVQEREAFRKAIQKFTVKNPSKKKSEIVAHFVLQRVARNTVYNILKKMEIFQRITDAKRSGRPSTWTSTKLKKLKRLANNRKGTSLRKLGRFFSVDKKTISDKLKMMKVSYRKRIKTPKYTVAQAERSRKVCRKLVNYLYKTKNKLIIDDEKYFCFSSDEIPGNSELYTDYIKRCPDSVRFKGVKKFPTKILVWVAISANGMSEPFIKLSKSESIKQHIYLDECLQKRLVPNDKHRDGNYLFWPDLASSHYASQNINFVAKDMNPANFLKRVQLKTFGVI